MANIIKKPRLAILGEFDGTDFVGNLYERGSNVVVGVLNTNSEPHFDIIAFLNGYGSKSGKDLNSQLYASKPSEFTSFVGGIDESGYFYLEGDADFELRGYSDNRAKFGFSGTESTVLTSGTYRLTASSRWKRGVFEIEQYNIAGLALQTVVGTATYSAYWSGIYDRPSIEFSTSQLSASEYAAIVEETTVLSDPGGNQYEVYVKYELSGKYYLTVERISHSVTPSASTVYTWTVGATNYSATSDNLFETQHMFFSTSVLTQAEYDSISLPQTMEDANGNEWIAMHKFQRYSYNRIIARPVGSFTFNSSLSWTGPDGTVSTWDAFPNPRRVQNLPTYLRVRGSVGDADDIYSGKCLEDWEYTAGNTDASLILEEDGHVSINYRSVYPYDVVDTNTALGKALLLRLGFNGTETETTTNGSYRQLKAANPAPCAMTSRGYVELRRETLGRDDFSIMADGSVISSGLAPIKGWNLLIRVTGPAHGYNLDRERHLREWWKYARRGLTIYPTFGDPDNNGNGGNDTRRHVNIETIYGTADRHTLFQTVEADESAHHYGKRVGGRLLVRRHPADAQERRESYSGEIDMHQDIRIRLLDDPTR